MTVGLQGLTSVIYEQASNTPFPSNWWHVAKLQNWVSTIISYIFLKKIERIMETRNPWNTETHSSLIISLLNRYG